MKTSKTPPLSLVADESRLAADLRALADRISEALHSEYRRRLKDGSLPVDFYKQNALAVLRTPDIDYLLKRHRELLVQLGIG